VPPPLRCAEDTQSGLLASAGSVVCVWSWSVVYRLRLGVSKSEAFPHTCKFQWSFQQQLCRPSTGRLRSLHALRAFTGKA